MNHRTHAMPETEPVFLAEQRLARMTTRCDGGGPPFAQPGRPIIYRLADVELYTSCPDHLIEIGGPRP